MGVGKLILLLIIILLVFGAGRLPQAMGDMGRAIRNLREGLKGEEVKKLEEKDKD